MNHSGPLRLRIYGRDCQAGSAEPGPVGEPLRVSLEQAQANLEQLPRMFVELDGSFLWTGPRSDSRSDSRSDLRSDSECWQLEGTIYDDGQVVRYVDLRGDCPLSAWQTFLAALEATLDTVTLELVENELIVPGTWLAQQLAGED